MKRWFLLCGLALLAGAAQAADQPEYAPPDAWVRPAAIPKAPAVAADSPAQVLLDDFQARMGPDGDDMYDERVMKILTPEGLSISGTIGQIWDPATETLVIHRLHIIRGDQVIDVLAGGEKFLVLRRENNLELAMLDGRLTATIQPEGLQVGDIVDVAMTVRRHDPALKGYSTGFDRLTHAGVASEVRMRAIWPASKAIRWRVTDGLDAPKVTKTADGGGELNIDMTNVLAPKPPLGAPARFQDVGSLELSQFSSWADVSRLMSPLFEKAATLKPGSPLSAEVAKIAASSPDPRVRAMAALRLVEDQTRYVFLGMNDGGLVPADAEVSWARRFGDCKGKTVLLTAILRALGVKADPALVASTNGDGMDQQLPMPQLFDHVIVRAEIGGKIYWLDGTRVGDRNLEALVTPPFHWALPLRPEGSDLVKLKPEDLTQPGFEVLLKVDESKGAAAPAPTHIELIYRGEHAVTQRAQVAALPHADFDRAVREYAGKTYPWLAVDTVTATDDEAANVAKVILDGKSTLDWSAASDGARFYRVPFSAVGGDFSYKREPGPHQDAPFLVAYPYFERRVEQFTLPTDGDFVLIGSDVDKTAAGLAMRRRARIDNGVLTVEITTHAIEEEFPAAEAEADGLVMRELGKSGVSVAYRTGGASTGADASAAERETDLAAAAQGDPAAELKAARIYGQGRGVPMDAAAAVGWLRKAADQGYAPAQTALGEIYMNGRGAPKDAVQGLALLRKAADQGDAEAEDVLASAYLTGGGVDRDPSLAFQYAQKAAASGTPSAELMLAGLYFNGQGVAKDVDQAIALTRKAAVQGNAQAQFDLDALLTGTPGRTPNYLEGDGWLIRAAEKGQAKAAGQLASRYLNGLGVLQDNSIALYWARRASAQGDPIGADVTGLIYLEGRGVPVDDAQAKTNFRQAAEQGLATAEAHLGYMYAEGRGGAKDYEQALAWYRKAADQGDPTAEVDLGNLYAMGHGVTRNTAEAIAWFQKSAEKGEQHAEYALGVAYLRGLGVPIDRERAVSWLAKSADQGNPQARQLLALIGRPNRPAAASR